MQMEILADLTYILLSVAGTQFKRIIFRDPDLQKKYCNVFFLMSK